MATDMRHNEHYEMAELICQRVEAEPGAWYDNESEALDRAKVKAELATAFETRTVALIGFLNWVDTHNVQVNVADYTEAKAQVLERLGL